jgi:hypothetical protein
MRALSKKDLEKIAAVSQITGLPLDDVVSLASEKGVVEINRGMSNKSGYRLLDETLDKYNRQGDPIKSCWGDGLTSLILAKSCPYLKSVSWTEEKEKERKAIFYCSHVAPFDLADEYLQRNLVIQDPAFVKLLGEIPKLKVTKRVKSLLESLLLHGTITIAIPGIISDATRSYCEKAEDGFPKFCPLPKR